ncbi:hypothetical protein NPIL_49441 [Nephila pilipes]|uniref:Uncharacterized protein n=1 Tax=Nephila pilipes TaxID=299642 RepID=A0A8X6UL52_NEPPI|nr:hypothetical protein NPIL_49441 [Nephila pilipes]
MEIVEQGKNPEMGDNYPHIKIYSYIGSNFTPVALIDLNPISEDQKILVVVKFISSKNRDTDNGDGSLKYPEVIPVALPLNVIDDLEHQGQVFLEKHN